MIDEPTMAGRPEFGSSRGHRASTHQPTSTQGLAAVSARRVTETWNAAAAADWKRG